MTRASRGEGYVANAFAGAIVIAVDRECDTWCLL